MFVSDIAIFVLKRDVKLQLTNLLNVARRNTYKVILWCGVVAQYVRRWSLVISVCKCVQFPVILMSSSDARHRDEDKGGFQGRPRPCLGKSFTRTYLSVNQAV